jgi:hypothetical protein
VNEKLDKTLVFSGREGRADIFGGKVGDMGLFSAHIWHNTPFLYAFSPPEWEKII